MDTTAKDIFRQDHISARRASGFSQTAYCRPQQLKLTTFTYWRLKPFVGLEARKYSAMGAVVIGRVSPGRVPPRPAAR